MIRRSNLKFRVINLNYKATIATLTLMIVGMLAVTISSVRASEPEGTRVPIIMYHSVLRSRSSKYVVSPEQIEEDLDYLQERGFETIVMADLIAYVHDGRPLPENPIILTFDDGYYNNMHYVVPLLEERGMRAVVSVVGLYTDRFSEEPDMNVNYAHFRWEDIKELIPTGIVEFQNHSYDLHTMERGRKGSRRKRGESLEEYREVLEEDLMKLQRLFQENVHFTPTTFTYPFGAFCKESVEIIRDLGFEASLSCVEGMNYITDDSDRLFGLKRYNRSGRTSTERFFRKVLD